MELLGRAAGINYQNFYLSIPWFSNPTSRNLSCKNTTRHAQGRCTQGHKDAPCGAVFHSEHGKEPTCSTAQGNGVWSATQLCPELWGGRADQRGSVCWLCTVDACVGKVTEATERPDGWSKAVVTRGVLGQQWVGGLVSDGFGPDALWQMNNLRFQNTWGNLGVTTMERGSTMRPMRP